MLGISIYTNMNKVLGLLILTMGIISIVIINENNKEKELV